MIPRLRGEIPVLSDTNKTRDFPSLETRTYLNTAAEGIPPRAVVDAVRQYAEDRTLGMDGRKLHEVRRKAAREAVGKAFGLSADEIGICSCSSEAYNLAALAMRFRDGDEVVINDLDFPAGATPWMQSSCPATVRVWRARDGALRVDDLAELLSSKTRLVTVSLVSFFNGFKIPLNEVVETVRNRSASLLALDVTQALGRIPLDLSGIDLIVSSTHKWILGTHGGGLVGVPSARAEELTVPAGGWFNLENAFEPDRFERVLTRPGAASFCVGMPNYAAIYAAEAALNYIESLGVTRIDEYARSLILACLEGLKKLDVELLTPDEPRSLSGILAFRHPRAEVINEYLHERDIHIMSHAGRLRVAIHFYNTMADVERLLAALKEALAAV